MPLVDFEGTVHEFPDDWTDAEISKALASYSEGDQLTQPASQGELSEVDKAVLSEQAMKPDSGGLAFDSALVPMDEKQEMFKNTIQQLETGGLKSEWVRTQNNKAQSTAYGTYQITRGLLRGYLQNEANMFTEEERGAMEELVRRQGIAIAIGGADRPRYEAGGVDHAQAKAWAKAEGFDSVESFLDAFDYGGTYGLENDVDWQVLYENFSRKILNDHLRRANGDQLEAASVWHGGSNYAKSKHKKDTELYRKKFSILAKL
jgi:hypothetical protein